MAKGKEKQIAVIAFIALLLNIALSALLVFVMKVPFSQVILATLLTYLIYVFVLGILGRRILQLKFDFTSTLKDMYPWRMMLPFALSLVLALIALPEIYFVIPFILYILLNFGDILKIKEVVFKVVKNPNFVNIYC